MSEAMLKSSGGKWVAKYGLIQKTFCTMKEAAQWLEECAEKERKQQKKET